MSITEEDTELRDLVAQTLEVNGVLGKIKAQLRASVFLALEDSDKKTEPPIINKELKSFVSTNEGKLIIALITECLNFFHLDYTLSVFEPESYLSLNQLENRKSLMKQLNIKETNEVEKLPLIVQLLKNTNFSKSEDDKLAPINNRSGISLAETLSPEDLIEAKKKFDNYDIDKSGFVDKNELRQLFVDFFPNAEENMLKGYLNNEFDSADKDFSSELDFDEFLSIYKRLSNLFSKNKKNNELDSHLLNNEIKNIKKKDEISSLHATDVSEDDDTFSEDKIAKNSEKIKAKNISDKYDKLLTTSTTSLVGLNAKKSIDNIEDVIEDLDDNYDEDFQESNISRLTPTPKQESKNEVDKSISSENSLASDSKNIKQIAKSQSIDDEDLISEDIKEDIEEEVESLQSELTSDRTVEKSQISDVFDYIEEAEKVTK